MCDTCGCNITPGNEHLVRADGKHARTEDGRAAVTVLKNLLSENDHQADHNREHFDRQGVLAINLMSSPGAGKTSLLEATIEALAGSLSIAVIEGDLETENDAERIRAKGVPAIQIATGSACHLDAHMVHDALHRLDLHGVDILFIENVGNLVCPASFDLGHHRNVTLLSIPEGDDKPAKYPVMFRAADLVLLHQGRPRPRAARVPGRACRALPAGSREHRALRDRVDPRRPWARRLDRLAPGRARGAAQPPGAGAHHSARGPTGGGAAAWSRRGGGRARPPPSSPSRPPPARRRSPSRASHRVRIAGVGARLTPRAGWV